MQDGDEAKNEVFNQTAQGEAISWTMRTKISLICSANGEAIFESDETEVSE